jgi:thymidylate synthase (FAD)
MNARSLLNFFELRCCLRAQWEIRLMAENMLRAVRAVAPVLFAKAGPSCVTAGVCREGDMTCGRLAALQRQAEESGRA